MNFLLALVSGSAVVSSLIWLICIGVVFWLLWWLLSYVKLPEPFNKVAQVILAIAAVVVLISVIMGFAGHPIISW